MNHNLFRPNPTIRDAHELRHHVEEIHSLARDLYDRSAGPTPPVIATKAAAPAGAPPPGREDNREADTKSVPVKSGAESRPPGASETPVAPSRPAGTSEARTAVVSAPVAAREQVTLPAVMDLRPELAAFIAAVTGQQAATDQTLRQTLGVFQRLAQAMERHSTELERLDRRLQHLVQR